MPDPVRVIGLGAGGHAKVVLETLAAMGGFDVVGLLDPRRELWQTEVLGVPVLGDDDLLGSHYDSGVRHAFIGLGSGADMRARAAALRASRARPGSSSSTSCILPRPSRRRPRPGPV